jgi:hypothetical protein
LTRPGRFKRHIINLAHGKYADNIVGKMTIAAIDAELLVKEQGGAQTTGPIVFPSRPIRVSQLKTLRRPMTDPDVVFLHALLNYHLRPDGDQLPVTGPGASDFGPRTEAKVRRFQEINNIDRGTAFFMDGVVGPHTWKVLNQFKQYQLDLTFIPKLQLTMPDFPHLPPLTPPPQIPTLHTDSIQIQIGETGTIPFRGNATGAHTLQIVGVFLSKANGFRVEGQVGPQIAFNYGPSADSKIDFAAVGVVNFANMPGSIDNFSGSIQSQLALSKSLTTSAASAQGSVLALTSVTLVKDKRDRDLLQATVQGGIFLELDPPSDSNDHRLGLKPGAITFFGLTGIVNF